MIQKNLDASKNCSSVVHVSWTSLLHPVGFPSHARWLTVAFRDWLNILCEWKKEGAYQFHWDSTYTIRSMLQSARVDHWIDLSDFSSKGLSLKTGRIGQAKAICLLPWTLMFSPVFPLFYFFFLWIFCSCTLWIQKYFSILHCGAKSPAREIGFPFLMNI